MAIKLGALLLAVLKLRHKSRILRAEDLYHFGIFYVFPIMEIYPFQI